LNTGKKDILHTRLRIQLFLTILKNTIIFYHSKCFVFEIAHTLILSRTIIIWLNFPLLSLFSFHLFTIKTSLYRTVFSERKKTNQHSIKFQQPSNIFILKWLKERVKKSLKKYEQNHLDLDEFCKECFQGSRRVNSLTLGRYLIFWFISQTVDNNKK